jgi:hypothetical protein
MPETRSDQQTARLVKTIIILLLVKATSRDEVDAIFTRWSTVLWATSFKVNPSIDPFVHIAALEHYENTISLNIHSMRLKGTAGCMSSAKYKAAKLTETDYR